VAIHARLLSLSEMPGRVQRPSTTSMERTGRAGAVGPTTLGVIDVGSNTARLVLFQASGAGALRALDERKETPRLGLGTGADGALSPDAMGRGVAALGRFAEYLEDAESPRTLAVATSAVRDAPNASEFLDQVRRATGITLRILSGAEEARYAYLGVASAWELDHDLVADLGGGSLQLAETREGAMRNSVSLPLGGLRLTQRHLEHDPPKEREVEELRESVRERVAASLEAFGSKAPQRVFGVGGTIRAMARAVIDLRDYPIARVHGYVLRDRDLEALYGLLADVPAAKRRAVAGIGSDRADVIVAGIVVFEELLRASNSRQIVVSGTGIREGIALEVVGAKLPVSAEELAHRSVAAAAEGIAFSLPHGELVAGAAGALFDRLAPSRGWGPGERRALVVAAWMHDSGIAVDLWRHARHSSYLLRNYPLWGLDHREGLIASLAAYLHEGDPMPSTWRKEFLPILREADLALVRELGVVLQVAELLAPAAPEFSLDDGGKVLSQAGGPGRRAPRSARAREGPQGHRTGAPGGGEGT
jgi:exopolyphosphatase/guanosine-5'-triphosphate,3'-diphosphate pyrophosphatase